MPVSGLVVSLSDEPSEFRAALKEIGETPEITVGDRLGNRLPVVVDTMTGEDDRRLWHWLHTLPGVRSVQLAFVAADPPSTGGTASDPSKRRPPSERTC